ncbi:guanylate kinase [Gudongella sp. DL1XJH-153]|uniref:guanylate kinase n=1 Tax=Gudongella sp. DL1XJH-153 TaxID=3409804 RepID=UPI003BB5B8A9
MINIVAFIGPSGSGKTTLAKYMNLRKVITFTTRPVRKGERDGVDYFFMEKKEFLRLYDEGELLEYTEYNGHLYGMGIKPLRDSISKGELISIVVDINGAKRLKEVFPDNLLVIGIRTPLEECFERMKERGDPDFSSRSKLYGEEIDAMTDISHVIILNTKDNWWMSRIIIEGIGSKLEETDWV